jgi:hypothetical protein
LNSNHENILTAPGVDGGVTPPSDLVDGSPSVATSETKKAGEFDLYVTGMPSAQNAVDALPDWNSALPPEFGVTAGPISLYDDNRIRWALEQFGSIKGKAVLEIGPFEASHTYMLDRLQPATLHAVEANKLAYLHCLVVKEIENLEHARFFLGDGNAWLESHEGSYDLIVACGVLYHMWDPIRFLALVAKRTNAVFLWTHYAQDEAMPPGDPRRAAFIGECEVEEFLGIPVRLHRRSYRGAARDTKFCGGIADKHRWMERDDILAILRGLGFDDLRISMDDPRHPNGPAFCVFARRSDPEESDVGAASGVANLIKRIAALARPALALVRILDLSGRKDELIESNTNDPRIEFTVNKRMFKGQVYARFTVKIDCDVYTEVRPRLYLDYGSVTSEKTAAGLVYNGRNMARRGFA